MTAKTSSNKKAKRALGTRTRENRQIQGHLWCKKSELWPNFGKKLSGCCS